VPPWELPEFEDEYEYVIVLNGKGITVDRETYLRYRNLAWHPPIKKIMGKNIITTITSNDKKVVEDLACEIFYHPCYPYKIHVPSKAL
jgi:sulfur relay (sulfurtransferase) DsrC/TusE family protein